MTCEELTERIKKYRPFNEQEEADKYIAAQSTVSTPNPIRRPVIRLSYHVFSFSICVEVDIPSIAFEFASA